MRGFHCLVRSDVLNELILDPTTAPLYFPQPPPPHLFLSLSFYLHSKPLLLSDGEAERAVVAAVVLQPLRVEPDSVRADSVEKVLWGWVARSPKKGASHVGTYIYIYIHIYIYIYIYTYICANCTRALEA